MIDPFVLGGTIPHLPTLKGAMARLHPTDTRQMVLIRAGQLEKEATHMSKARTSEP